MAKKQVPERKQFNNPNVVGLRAEVLEQPITETLEQNYMPYAMSVIISRAIPEIDGFKPSHRKILYTMYKMVYTFSDYDNVHLLIFYQCR